jgi:hypothetical protein
LGLIDIYIEAAKPSNSYAVPVQQYLNAPVGGQGIGDLDQ